MNQAQKPTQRIGKGEVESSILSRSTNNINDLAENQGVLAGSPKPKTFLKGAVEVHSGDCLDVIRTLPDCSVDSVVTDPPYALVSIQKRLGSDSAVPIKSNGASGVYARAASGFMGKQWDTGERAFAVEFWQEVYRVLKPGGHVLAFAATRTHHRLACAIEDAGFEIRDMVAYLYGTGFPKSHNVSRNMGDARCTCEAVSERNVRPVRNGHVSPPLDLGDERGEVLLASLSEQGSPADGLQRPAPASGGSQPRMERRGDVPQEARELRLSPVCEVPARAAADGASGRVRDGAPAGDGSPDREATVANGMRASSGPRAAEQPSDELGALAGQSEPQERGAWPHCQRCGKPMVPDGLGSALKPAIEPICVARKPLIGSLVENTLKWGTGAINVDGCRVGTTKDVPASPRRAAQGPAYGDLGNDPGTGSEWDKNIGRWPANIVHDGSDEVVAAFPDSKSCDTPSAARCEGTILGGSRTQGAIYPGESGSAARFFYSAKADSQDRLGSKHPTVKPVDLMQWLVRLVTPKGGVVLDPFAGTGTTGEAAFREGCRAILIEREAEYQADIERRMGLVLGGPDERRHAIIKAKGKLESAGPLFD